MALGAEEGEAHRAADQDLVGDVEEALDQRDLVGDLGAAQHQDERPLRVVAHGRQLADFALKQQPRVGGQVRGDAGRARVGAVAGAEGVVDVEVGEARQGLGERRVVLRLARLVARVLEQEDLAGAEREGHLLHPLPHHIRRHPHRRSNELGEPLGDRRQRQPGLAVLGPPEVRAEDQRGAALAQQLDRRQGGADAGVVADPPVDKRNVEVDADEHAPPRDLGVANARLAEAQAAAGTALGCSTLAASSTQRFE